jgi:epsin
MNYTDYIEKARDLANSVYDQGVKALSKTETERRLAEALSHANWGASTTLMGEIAQATTDLNEFQVIMREIWAACAVTGRNWRVAYKGLALLEFLLKNGHKRVITEAKENRSKIRRLETFSYQRDGVEKGTGVREKAKVVTELLDDDEHLKSERAEAAKLRSKFTGVGRDGQQSAYSSGMGGGGYDDFDGEKVGSDISDDEDDSKKKKKSSKKKSSKKKGSDDEDEPAAELDDDDDFGSSKKSSSKSKKKAQDDDDDIDFSPKFSATKKATTSKSAASTKKKQEDDDVDDDFGFSDDDSSKKKKSSASAGATSGGVKLGPLASISVKIPGAAGSSSSSTVAAKKAEDKEVDLLGDFDPFGSSSATPASAPAQSTPQPNPQQNQAANILNMFNTPPAAPTGNAFGSAFPQAQAGFAPAPQMGGFPGGGFPQMGGVPQQQPMMGMMGQQQQPPMMGVMGQPQPMMGMMGQQQQQPMMGMMGQPQQQQPMMMGGMTGFPQMGQAQPMMGQAQPMMGQPMMMGMSGGGMKKPGAADNSGQKKDAFSGLMNMSFSSAPSGGQKGGSLI